MTESKESKKSYTRKILSTAKAIIEDTQSDSRNKIIANLKNNKDEKADKNTTDYLGVTASIVIMEPVTESQSFRRIKQPLKSCPGNKRKVLLDSGMDGGLYFLQNDKTKPFHT